MTDRIRIEGVEHDYWDDHPLLADWKYEVANGDTRLGFWDWVGKRLGYE